MDVELKAKWVAALRSGEYQQITGQLRGGGGYCCLGVFCIVAGLPISDNGISVETTAPDCYQPIVDLIGTQLSILWAKNDNRVPFPEIADWIEANL